MPHLPDTITYRVTWLNDPETARYLGTQPTTVKEQEEWFSHYLADTTRKFFTILGDETPIGVVGLTNINREKSEVQIFIMIGDSACRGKGIGKQAMHHIIEFAQRELGINHLSLEVHQDNKAAIQCYQSVGFVVSGSVNDEGEIVMTLKEK